MKRMLRVGCGLAILAALTLSESAYAGPFIFAGTDADDHGSANGGGNLDGWLFMQRAIESLAASSELTNGNMVVVNLGSNAASSAANAAASAFNFSSLGGGGWSFVNLGTDAEIQAFFDLSGGTNISNTGIIMMDSASNVSGGTSGSELALFTANAALLDGFLGGGGGLFSQANGYGWVNALLPTLTTPSEFLTGIALTPGGSASFPGLTDADLSAGPYHNRFENFGAIPVLARGTGTQSAIIIGSSGGSVTNPDPPSSVPEPATWTLFGLGSLAIAVFRRKSEAQRS